MRSTVIPIISLTALLISASFSAQCQNPQLAHGFLEKKYINAKGESLRYLLFVPANYDARKKYPLVLWLHGGGARGEDLKLILSWGDKHGPLFFARTDNQSAFPSFILAPQCPPGKLWADPYSSEPLEQIRLVMEILNKLQTEYAINSARLYVIGISMGGYATWDIIARRPNAFAAAVAICGGGDASKARAMVNTPIWTFHGDKDEQVNVSESRKMIEAIRMAGGKPRYTEYKGIGHNSWEAAFKEQDFLSWIYSQKRK